jgi:putative nucleotidyltransferase with HDIG domain
MSTLTLPQEFHPSTQETHRAVLSVAHASGCKLYLVGGYVRDWLLGRFSSARLPKDFDYSVKNGSAVKLAQEVAAKLDGHFVMLDQDNDTARVVLDNGTQIDLAGCVGGTIETDIQRRDLTINAMAWDPDQPENVIDLVGGQSDLNTKIIRAISEQAFVEDPLRLLRTFRFASSLGFAIDPNTMKMVQTHAQKLARVASERISYETFAIMETSRAGQTVRAMSAAGLLDIIFPEMLEMHRVPPNSFHHLPLYDHSLEALDKAEAGFHLLPDWAREPFDWPLSNQISRLGATKLASLLHDIGKPQTWAVQQDGRHTFIGHDKIGADMSFETSKRLKWSKPVERFTANLIRWHLRPGALFHQGEPTERAIHRFYKSVGDETPQLILLAQADFRSTCGPGLADKQNRQHLENCLLELLRGYIVFREGTRSTNKLLDGTDVMNILNIAPGPAIGQLLEELEEAQALREVVTREQATEFVLEKFKQKYSK